MNQRDMLLGALQDLSGWREEDFEGMSVKEIIDTLTPSQMQRVDDYLGGQHREIKNQLKKV